MTPEAQQRAIAVACGWEEAFPQNGKPHELTKRGGILLPYHWVRKETGARAMDLPDYLYDLNAVHEAEMTLDEDHYRRFVEILDDLVHGISPYSPRTVTANRGVVSAKPYQRAEAFLRVKSLWKEAA